MDVSTFFIDENVFHDMVAKHEFLEYAHVYSHWYGTPRKPLMEKMEQGIDVLLEIDVQGALQIKEKFGDAVYIFILPPSMDVLRTQLRRRGGRTPRRKSFAVSKGQRRSVVLSGVLLYRPQR